MDMGMLVIFKLPEWLVSTDGWRLMPLHNDIPALFKVTTFAMEGCSLYDSKVTGTDIGCKSEMFMI